MVKANMIRSRMALLEMSQRTLADRLGISTNTLSGRMTGKSSFTLEEIERLCSILEIRDSSEKLAIFLS